jgi:hypothetical protein
VYVDGGPDLRDPCRQPGRGTGLHGGGALARPAG